MNQLVDVNGKVKQGHEGRASFITSTLKEALGIEIDMVDGVIKNYDDLTDSFDKVMEKKKAMVILENQETTYKEAVNEKANLLQSQNKLEQEMLDLEQQRIEKEKELKLGRGLFLNGITTKELNDINNTIKEKQEQYKTQESMLLDYNTTIGIYETNASLAHEERYNEMINVDAQYLKNIETNGDQKKALLEQQIEDEKLNLDYLLKQQQDSNSNIYNEQINASKKRLEQLQGDLTNYTSTVENGNNNATTKWHEGIGNQLSAITGKKYEFKDAGNGQVAMYINGVQVGEPMAENEMQAFADNMIVELNKKDQAKEAGEDFIDGVNQGVSNPNKQKGVFGQITSLGDKMLEKLRTSLQEHSPSKATNKMGQFLLEGLGLGIDKKENTILKQIRDFGKSVISELNNELNQETDLKINTNFSEKLNDVKNSLFSINSSLAPNYTEVPSNSTVNNFNQVINAPKQPSRLELYRQTKNLLNLASK